MKNITTEQSLKDLLIRVGIPLQIHIGGTNNRLKSSLVGFEFGEYLVIKYPLRVVDTQTSRRLVPGEQILVRYLYKGTIYGFKTEIIAAFIQAD